MSQVIHLATGAFNKAMTQPVHTLLAALQKAGL